MTDTQLYVRKLAPGMGQAVAERTILRQNDGIWETWGDVAHRVAVGNSLLCPERDDREIEREILEKHIAKGNILLSGRHLQHGDKNQPSRNGEVFTNCSMAATSFLSFYLLLNGSGVGRVYDDEICLVNWDYAPTVRCVLSESHPDFNPSAHESTRDAIHKYGQGKDVMWFKVPDSREGWAKAVEIWENAAHEKIHKDKMLILDFSDVRAKNKPIGGMQNRPASGPVPLMNAIMKASSLRGAGLEPWLQAMYVDHYMAECVLVGGARRAARMAAKSWRDPSILKFIEIKRPIEFYGKTLEEVTQMRLTGWQGSFLWSSNNSVFVDADFWNYVDMDLATVTNLSESEQKLAIHAKKVFEKIVECSYGDGTGEPGVINQDKLVAKNKGIEKYKDGDYVGSKKYQVNEDTRIYLSKLAKKVLKMRYSMGVNPCSEICMLLLGAYCVIADVVPYHCDTLDEAEEAVRAATRALIRVNLMDCMYSREVQRTNRIGVGLTGVHEFAWKFFQNTFYDLIDEEKSKDFWAAIARLSQAVTDEAIRYSKELGVEVPHTALTMKPAGTTSKLFGLTEAWHLPSMVAFLRYVQFRNGDPLIAKYEERGYPVKKLRTSYEGTTIVGFPTAPELTMIMPATRIVTASQATPEEQYRWIQLGEKYWLFGGKERSPDAPATGNQISYTLKYDPTKVSFASFREMFLKYQRTISCCSVMPHGDVSSYEYLPETPVSMEEYEKLKDNITLRTYEAEVLKEEIDRVHVDCANGACPIDFKDKT